MNAKDANARKSPYMDLLKVTKNTTTLMDQMLNRQKQLYDRYPFKVALDGEFESKNI